MLTASELLGPSRGAPAVGPASLLSSLGPGAVPYLLSLTRVALSASLETPWRRLWAGARPLESVLRGPLYEVRELVLDGLLTKLDEEEEEEEAEEQEKELAQEKRSWLDKSTLFTLSSLALNESHPQCLAKVGPHTHAHTRTHTQTHAHTDTRAQTHTHTHRHTRTDARTRTHR